MTALTLLVALLGLTSCSQNDAVMNNDKETSIMDNNNSSDKPTTTTDKDFYADRFTLSSTVEDVITNSAFGDFGRLLFPVDRIVAFVSRFFTLRMGDLIYTGTPSGVGPVAIGDHLEGFIGDKRLLDFYIK